MSTYSERSRPVGSLSTYRTLRSTRVGSLSQLLVPHPVRDQLVTADDGAYIWSGAMKIAFSAVRSQTKHSLIQVGLLLVNRLSLLPSQHDMITSFTPPDPAYEQETALLMYYLDYVFHDQYPFYDPAVAPGGRSWLLPLLTSTKPVYYATLSLSALHMNSNSVCGDSVEVKKARQRRSESHHGIALQELHSLIEISQQLSGSQKVVASVHTLACMVQLIFFGVRLPVRQLISTS